MAYGAVDRRVWNDERFREWDRDTRDVWLYLLTCPHGNRLGCFVLPVLYIADDVQITPDAAEEALRVLERVGRIVRDRVTRTLCIVNHLHPDYNPLSNGNVVKAALQDLSGLPDSEACLRALLAAVDEHWKDHYLPLQQALTKRLEAIAGKGSRKGTGKGSRKGTGKGSPNPSERVPERVSGIARVSPDPEPDPDPEQEPDPGGGEQGVTRQASRAGEPSRSPPSPPADQPNGDGERGPGDPDGPVATLRTYLGGRPVVDRLASKVRSADRWALALMGLYGPNGTKERLMVQIPEPDRPLAIATALLRFEGEGQDWDGKFFAGIIRKVVGEFRRGDATGPDHGDETERDRQRASEARSRASRTQADELRRREQEADDAREAAWTWYQALGPESSKRREVEGDAEKRIEVMASSGVPISDTSKRMALLEAIQKHMPDGEAATVS